MKISRRTKIQILRDYSIAWTFALLFLCVVRGVGTKEMGSLQFSFENSILLSLIVGPVFGLLSGFTRIITLEKIYRRIPIMLLLMVRLSFSIVFLGLLITASYYVLRVIIDLDKNLFDFAFNKGSMPIYFYILVVDMSLTVVNQVSHTLGDNKLWQILTARYYHPKFEYRIFMFLDLKGSTEIAEKLGHIRYSKLLQDSFNDLAVVSANEAEVYQYVGDEAVLTWTFERGVKEQNCVHAYFNFKSRIILKKHYYSNSYGVIPEFKAGVHYGNVTATEVGSLKKEIAYHGEVLNTASRIQGLCNQLNSELLISESLKIHLGTQNFIFEDKGPFELKGVQEKVRLYSVSAKID